MAEASVVDGNNHQIDRIKAESAACNIQIPIVIDFVHVPEYRWGAASSFFAEADPTAERGCANGPRPP